MSTEPTTRTLHLTATPNPAFIDQPIHLLLTGALPNERVRLTAWLIDDAGRRWESRAEFTADATGSIDPSRDAPLPSGSPYRAVDPMGLFWSMRLNPEDAGARHQNRHQNNDQYLKRELTPTEITIEASAPSLRHIARLRIERHHVPPNATIRAVDGDHQGKTLAGLLFIPAPETPEPCDDNTLSPDAASAPRPRKRPAVITLGGSGGGLDWETAAAFSAHGYAALALPYFGFDPLPSSLNSIPLEYFERAIAWLCRQPEIDPGRLAIHGISRGGELALLLATKIPLIRAVVGVVPGNVVWQATGTPPPDSPADLISNFQSPSRNETHRGNNATSVALPLVPPSGATAYYEHATPNKENLAPASESSSLSKDNPDQNKNAPANSTGALPLAASSSAINSTEGRPPATNNDDGPDRNNSNDPAQAGLPLAPPSGATAHYNHPTPTQENPPAASAATPPAPASTGAALHPDARPVSASLKNEKVSTPTDAPTTPNAPTKKPRAPNSNDSRSSWTYRGSHLPFVPYAMARFRILTAIGVISFRRPVRFVNLHRDSLRQKDAALAAEIPVENAAAAILLISAEDDQVWPSEPMADAIVRRLTDHYYPHEFTHLKNPGAGHLLRLPHTPATTASSKLPNFGLRVAFGGNPADTAAARLRSWLATLSFLSRNLK
jgi:hypothetical protein